MHWNTSEFKYLYDEKLNQKVKMVLKSDGTLISNLKESEKNFTSGILGNDKSLLLNYLNHLSLFKWQHLSLILIII